MTKNKMQDIAKLLEIEFGEEFKIEREDSYVYKLTERGLECRYITETLTAFADDVLRLLLIGNLKIVKLPYKPEIGDIYYAITFYNISPNTKYEDFENLAIARYEWTGSESNYLLYKANMIYRTREECQKHLKEDFEKLVEVK